MKVLILWGANFVGVLRPLACMKITAGFHKVYLCVTNTKYVSLLPHYEVQFQKNPFHSVCPVSSLSYDLIKMLLLLLFPVHK